MSENKAASQARKEFLEMQSLKLDVEIKALEKESKKVDIEHKKSQIELLKLTYIASLITIAGAVTSFVVQAVKFFK